MTNYFSKEELSCSCCDKYHFDALTLQRLNQLRLELNHPIIINSGYRCKDHNIRIGATQTHASGQAVDISIRGKKAHRLLGKAIELGFTGVGVSQKGDSRFIHLDDLEATETIYRPTVWSY